MTFAQIFRGFPYLKSFESSGDDLNLFFMESTLNERIVRALLSANEAGRIELPAGSALKKDAFMENLKLLQRMGFVTREKGTAFYRPYRLTEKGANLRYVLLKAEQVSA